MSMLARLATTGGAPPTYVDDVFSTYLYTGNNSTQTINNGIDLAGKGGMVWFKDRSSLSAPSLFDTARGRTKVIFSDGTQAELTNPSTDGITSFNANGFSLGPSFLGGTNISGAPTVSWTFRKAPKFFDVVTYTGNGTGGRQILHSLGAVPGCVIVKRTDTSGNWQIYHRGLTSASYVIRLNSTVAQFIDNAVWGGSGPTATDFNVSTEADVNANGGTYVAYLFAHDTAADGLAQCGSYTGNGSATGPAVTLGWEPQWLMIKNASGTGNWNIFDNMRGLTVGGDDAYLEANTADIEASANWVLPTSNGFQIVSTSTEVNTNASTYIYVAIRRSNKPPTAGTQVFQPLAQTGTGAATTMNFGIVTDWIWSRLRAATGSVCGPLTWDRLRGPLLELNTSTTSAESSRASSVTGFDSMVGVLVGTTYPNSSSTGAINYSFKRAAGFFDVVCYAGTGSNTTLTHGLGVVPEMILIAARSGTPSRRWSVGHKINSFAGGCALNSSAAMDNNNFTYFASTAPTAFVFSLPNAITNDSGVNYVAYLFATLAGVSKVDSYTGNGSSQTINCGFSAGARFVLIKRTDSTGNWYFWDTARGIVAGNDPWLTTNDTSIAEQTADDSVDSDSSGFVVNQNGTTNINVSSATYLYLAIA